MLVLSRRIQEKILFPTIQASIQVVTVKPGVVRLGIEAPGDLPVFREEVLLRDPDKFQELTQKGEVVQVRLQELVHKLNNRLNASTIGLALLRRQLERSMYKEARTTLEKIDQELRALQEQSNKLNEEVVQSRAPRRALLVEDDQNECELLAGFLRMAGLEVTTAGDGADALDHLRTGLRPDFILLDMILPRCDGPTTVRTIRHDPDLAGLKIFGVSGVSPEKFDLSQGPEGIDRWYPKPLNPEDLLRELNEELGKPEAALS